MGVTNVFQNPSINTKFLTLLGRIMELDSNKEVIKQLPLEIAGHINNNYDNLFQRTLNATTRSVVFPYPDTVQFAVDANGVLTGINGYNNNTIQPNFIFIHTNRPVKVTFGYCPSMTSLKYYNGSSYVTLDPQPANINMSFLVNGYYLKSSRSISTSKKLCPSTQTEYDAWCSNNTILIETDDPVTGDWEDAGGRSEIFPIYPIKIEKLDNYTDTQVKVYTTVLYENNSVTSCSY